jgi:hypothetical protein
LLGVTKGKNIVTLDPHDQKEQSGAPRLHTAPPVNEVLHTANTKTKKNIESILMTDSTLDPASSFADPFSPREGLDLLDNTIQMNAQIFKKDSVEMDGLHPPQLFPLLRPVTGRDKETL